MAQEHEQSTVESIRQSETKDSKLTESESVFVSHIIVYCTAVHGKSSERAEPYLRVAASRPD